MLFGHVTNEGEQKQIYEEDFGIKKNIALRSEILHRKVIRMWLAFMCNNCNLLR